MSKETKKAPPKVRQLPNMTLEKKSTKLKSREKTFIKFEVFLEISEEWAVRSDENIFL